MSNESKLVQYPWFILNSNSVPRRAESSGEQAEVGQRRIRLNAQFCAQCGSELIVLNAQALTSAQNAIVAVSCFSCRLDWRFMRH